MGAKVTSKQELNRIRRSNGIEDKKVKMNPNYSKFCTVFSLFFYFFSYRGLDPPEKPSVIKTASLGNEEPPNVNQIAIQDDVASDITTHNDGKAPVKTVTNKRNTAAGLSNKSLGNTGNVPENKEQMKQQACKGRRGVNGVLPANSSSSWGSDRKTEKVCDREFLDDDDDILAAVADDDYFVMEEDFDMEQIDQLEMGMQNTTSKTDKQTTTSNMINSDNKDLEMFYDDEIFEDDFVEEDLLAEATDSVEIKPLHERICNEGTMRTMHSLKKARTSNSSSLEFGSRARNTSSPNNTNIKMQSNVNSRNPKDTGCTSNSAKTEPIVLMNNSTFNSCNVFINTGQCYKPRNAGTKSNIQIKKEPDNESISGLVNNDVTTMVVDIKQHHHNVHNIHVHHVAQGNIELISVQ